jgi:hypothetical protein
MARDGGREVGVARTLVRVTDELLAFVEERMRELRIANAGALANRTEGAVSMNTLYRLLGHRQPQINRKTIDALALALKTDEKTLLELCGQSSEPWTLPPDFDNVPLELRPEIERALRQLLLSAGHLVPPDQDGRRRSR